MQQLRQLVEDFVAERQWHKFHDPKNLSMAIAIEAAELMEQFQWARSEDLSALLADERVVGEIRDELADVLCFSLALANVVGFDLAEAIEQKMVKNRRKYPAQDFLGRYEKPRD
ncbi:MAG: nucleotide pyrophosphohydrolase [Planctomycetota bacterium]|nr:MAG: nucleotide pyrophosphohydrolase [Planctomycetota bacterium]